MIHVAKLNYVTNVSLDGFIEDEHGSFNWTEPNDEVFAFITDLVRPYGTYLYGRRLYETMSVWETEPALAADSDLSADFASLWVNSDKVVYSTTLTEVSTSNTRLESTFDVAAVQALKDASLADMAIGGAEIAGEAVKAGLVDEYHVLVRQVVLGRGKPALPADLQVDLELLEARPVGGEVAYLRYRVANLR